MSTSSDDEGVSHLQGRPSTTERAVSAYVDEQAGRTSLALAPVLVGDAGSSAGRRRSHGRSATPPVRQGTSKQLIGSSGSRAVRGGDAQATQPVDEAGIRRLLDAHERRIEAIVQAGVEQVRTMLSSAMAQGGVNAQALLPAPDPAGPRSSSAQRRRSGSVSSQRSDTENKRNLGRRLKQRGSDLPRYPSPQPLKDVADAADVIRREVDLLASLRPEALVAEDHVRLQPPSLGTTVLGPVFAASVDVVTATTSKRAGRDRISAYVHTVDVPLAEYPDTLRCLVDLMDISHHDGSHMLQRLHCISVGSKPLGPRHVQIALIHELLCFSAPLSVKGLLDDVGYWSTRIDRRQACVIIREMLEAVLEYGDVIGEFSIEQVSSDHYHKPRILFPGLPYHWYQARRHANAPRDAEKAARRSAVRVIRALLPAVEGEGEGQGQAPLVSDDELTSIADHEASATGTMINVISHLRRLGQLSPPRSTRRGSWVPAQPSTQQDWEDDLFLQFESDEEKPDSSGARMRTSRLTRDLNDFNDKNAPHGITVSASKDLRFWTAMIQGPPDSPFEGGVFPFRLVFPRNFPLSPPVVSAMLPTLRHPNIFPETHVVCMDLLQGQWRPVYSVTTLLLSVMMLLAEANATEAADPEIAALMLKDPKGYGRACRKMVEDSWEFEAK